MGRAGSGPAAPSWVMLQLASASHAHAAIVLGAGTPVPCVDGRDRTYVNLDYAASAPPLAAVWDAVAEFMPWCSSVHRGSGAKSQASTEAYERTRDAVAAFVGARADHGVVFV